MIKKDFSFDGFHLPRWDEIPSIGLYSEQVITYIQETLQPLKIDDTDPPLTTAMINNYVKCKLIPPTEKKRYSRKHIAFLIVISVFKKIYAIPKIVQMIHIQSKLFEPKLAYDYFCTELENSLQTIHKQDIQLSEDTSQTGREERLLVRASVNAFALKLLVEFYLAQNSIPQR